MASYFVYILKCADGTLYTGITNNLERRIAIHNSGKGAKYTRCRTPVSMIYWEECSSKSAALQRELEIKRMPRAKKLLLCSTFS